MTSSKRDFGGIIIWTCAIIRCVFGAYFNEYFGAIDVQTVETC